MLVLLKRGSLYTDDQRQSQDIFFRFLVCEWVCNFMMVITYHIKRFFFSQIRDELTSSRELHEREAIDTDFNLSRIVKKKARKIDNRIQNSKTLRTLC